MKTTAMVAVIALMAAFLLVPVSDVDGAYSDINGEKNVIGTGDDAEFQIVYTNNDFNGYDDMNMSITYTASLKDSAGETISKGVSPSSGDLESGVSKTLTVSAPDNAGDYTLVVEYKAEVTYNEVDEEGEKTEKTETLTSTDEYDIRVVEPIKLSVTLTNDSDMSLESYGVYFKIDGEIVTDSYQTINLDASGTTTVTYEWVATPGSGSHTFALVAADGGNMANVSGLDVEHTFYIGDNDYTWMIALLVVVIVLVILVMVWVYRKPVKNYGKPKSRR